ncbi:putative nicotinate phosphoribosyltransferase [Ralstonia phage RP31]|uniref:Nicotinamide phosphoribosyltransferase n=2 Tax=Ripduovirus RP12 TaxID=2560700 RepID=A0A1L7N141_9CAUD|nr:nicotinamide phosphoribosyl transferase [Ralstonia phage RP12]BAW19185.1 putative nicotinate phosphoribosyltransferase [Ralstonia phage RP12]BAW19471.1 putative nicotinate phosphoribosyltransferase [Ralstonia phage RP31]
MMQDTSFDLFAPTATDGYKVGHRPLYPNGTNFTYSNGTFRSDKLFLDNKSKSRFWDHKFVLFGVQGSLREINGLWKRSFFDKPKDAVCKRYARRMKHYLGDNRVDVKCFEALHDLQYLPINVLALPEGSRVNMNVPVYVAYNTHPDFFWLVNYLETIMSSLIWKMSTNATIAYEYRRTFEYWADMTGVDRSFVDIQGHDFAFRGLSGPEDAARVGSGHLVVFKGTDTLPAIDYVEDMYGANVEEEFVACSVVATEHAVATSNILFNVSRLVKKISDQISEITQPVMDDLRSKGEEEFIREVLTVKHPTGIVSLVSDSFDFWKVITEVAPNLKDVIINRTPDEMGMAKTVFRPDSGNPVEILCGTAYPIAELEWSKELSQAINARLDARNFDPLVVRCKGRYYTVHLEGDETFTEIENPTPEMKGAVQCLWETFGGTETALGFKVLHERVGLIYGDSITVERADEILRRLYVMGFASCNAVFGIGSYTYQHNTRDTLGFAVKATAVQVEDDLIELFKAPKTERDTLKKSAKGFLRVVKDEAKNFVLQQEQEFGISDIPTHSGELRLVYSNSVFTNEVKLKDITATLLAA